MSGEGGRRSIGRRAVAKRRFIARPPAPPGRCYRANPPPAGLPSPRVCLAKKKKTEISPRLASPARATLFLPSASGNFNFSQRALLQRCTRDARALVHDRASCMGVRNGGASDAASQTRARVPSRRFRLHSTPLQACAGLVHATARTAMHRTQPASIRNAPNPSSHSHPLSASGGGPSVGASICTARIGRFRG